MFTVLFVVFAVSCFVLDTDAFCSDKNTLIALMAWCRHTQAINETSVDRGQWGIGTLSCYYGAKG